MLEAAGVSRLEEHAYRLLVGVLEAEPADLARDLGVTVAEAGRLLESLRAKGLASLRDYEDPPRFAAIAPDVGLGPMLLSTLESIELARRTVSDLADEYRSNIRRRDAGQLVEVIVGRPAIRQQIRNLQLGARKELLWFCRSGHVVMPSEDNSEEFEMLARGVRYQVIYERALLEEPGMIHNVAEGIRKGEQARATARLPVRMAIADRSVGLCPLVTDRGGPGEPTAALIRDSHLLTALVALFESYWSSASPLHISGGDYETVLVEDVGETIGSDDLYLLSLLVAGVSDKAIATQLGVSQRTVQRRIRALMDQVDADSRTQLAWQVASRGWLSKNVRDSRPTLRRGA